MFLNESNEEETQGRPLTFAWCWKCMKGVMLFLQQQRMCQKGAAPICLFANLRRPDQPIWMLHFDLEAVNWSTEVRGGGGWVKLWCVKESSCKYQEMLLFCYLNLCLVKNTIAAPLCCVKWRVTADQLSWVHHCFLIQNNAPIRKPQPKAFPLFTPNPFNQLYCIQLMTLELQLLYIRAA